MGVGGQRHAPAALPPGETRYPLYRRLGGPQGRSGRLRKISPATGIRSPDRPAGRESLYRLSYRGRNCYKTDTLTLHTEIIRRDFSKKFILKIIFRVWRPVTGFLYLGTLRLYQQQRLPAQCHCQGHVSAC